MPWRPRLRSGDRLGTAPTAVAAVPDDDKVKAVMILIPVEVIAAFNLIAAISAIPTKVLFVITLAMIPITGLYVAFGTREDGKGIAWRQVVLAPFAFACWISAMQGAMLTAIFPWWQSWIGNLALALGTLLLPILNGILKALNVPQNALKEPQK